MTVLSFVLGLWDSGNLRDRGDFARINVWECLAVVVFKF